MGLRDRIKGSLRSFFSPITVWLAGEGSDRLVYSGGPATVVVAVRGEDDGTADRVEVALRHTGHGGVARDLPLGTVLPTVGRHELAVTIPAGLPPSFAQYSDYRFLATLHRTKGIGSDATEAIDVVGRIEDVHWPPGPRSGQEHPELASLEVALGADVVSVGSTVEGTVTVLAPNGLRGPVTLALGPTITSPVHPRGRFRPVAELELAHGVPPGQALTLPFAVAIPEGLPPTLSTGPCSVVWQARVEASDAAAWHLLGVLDPQARAGHRDAPSPGLLEFLADVSRPTP